MRIHRPGHNSVELIWLHTRGNIRRICVLLEAGNELLTRPVANPRFYILGDIRGTHDRAIGKEKLAAATKESSLMI